MSEKLYEPIEAIDILDVNEPDLIPKLDVTFTLKTECTPKRYLVFMDQEGNRYEAYFPKNRTTLLFEGIFYDWYGRELPYKILSHFGYYESGIANLETFVVKEGDWLAIAYLKYDYPGGYYGHSRTTVRPMDQFYRQPILDSDPGLRHNPWVFTKFQEPPATDNCLQEINKQLSSNFGFTCKICTGVVSWHRSHNGITFCKTYAKKEPSVPSGYSYWLKHRIFSYREHIFSQGPVVFAREEEEFDGELSFSEDGKKITFSGYASSSSEKQHIRISTDIEVIRHTHCSGEIICWYYDPEP